MAEKNDTSKKQAQCTIQNVTCCGFKVGDKVNTPSGEGEVWKVTETSVHIKHWHGAKNCPHDWLYSKYLTEVTHHAQNPVSVLSHL
jgi:hypothetical protein